MKRRFFPLLLILTLLLSGCGKLDESAPYDPLDELRDYYGTEEVVQSLSPTDFTLPYCGGETWDPITCPDGVQRTVTSLVYETMFALDETFTPHPLLVERWQYDAETMTYTLFVRSGVRFSDGALLTAQDVADSLQRAMTAPRYSPRFTQVKKVAVQNGAVEVVLTEDNRSFTALLDIPVVRSGTETAAIPIGTGPYVPTADLTQLTLHKDWWQGLALPFDSIDLHECKSEEAAAYAFASNDVHLFVNDLLSDSGLPAASGDSAVYAETTVMHYLGFNMGKSYLSDPVLRQAISLAVDRQSLVNASLSGHAAAAQFAVNPASPLYPADLEKDTSSVAVREALSAASLSDGEWKYQLRLLVNSENSFKVAAAQQIADMLGRYDFDVSVLVVDWEDYLYNLNAGNYDLYYGQCKLRADWDIAPLAGTAGALNYGRYGNETTDALLLALRTAKESERAEAMRALCLQMQSDVPLIPLCFERTDLLMNGTVAKNVSPTDTNPFYDLTYWQVQPLTRQNETP